MYDGGIIYLCISNRLKIVGITENVSIIEVACLRAYITVGGWVDRQAAFKQHV